MNVLEVVLIGIALSADAFSVTVSNVFANPGMSRGKKLSMPLAFSVFQGLMPLLGFLLGGLFAAYIERYAGIVSFIILAAIGGKMLWDGVHDDDPDPERDNLKAAVLLLQAVATSIDAFAVGVSFAAEAVAIVPACCIIACCTFVCCLLALAIGRKLGDVIGRYAQCVGGVVLVIIGVKALF
jgi:putative Mn2+ efflux pump MntP